MVPGSLVIAELRRDTRHAEFTLCVFTIDRTRVLKDVLRGCRQEELLPNKVQSSQVANVPGNRFL